MKLPSIFVTILSVCLIASPLYAQSDDAFVQWREELRKEAIAGGINAEVFDQAFSGVQPLEKVVSLDRKQPEHKITMEEYLQNTVTPARIENGRRELEANKELLAEISKKYSVPASVIVALWGMETSYGENTGSFNIVASLATLAYDGRRSQFFRSELLKSLHIMQEEGMSPDSFIGSWAGAFGQCQFMPTSYEKYAVDYDKDGKRDIWYTPADVFASIANYLHSEGWDYEGNIKEGNNNFKVLLKWNRSRYFATAISKLMDGINN